MTLLRSLFRETRKALGVSNAEELEGAIPVSPGESAPPENQAWWYESSPDLQHQRVLPLATYSPWLTDLEFQETYDQVSGNTLVDIYRCYELWSLAKQLDSVPGCFVEVGVWRGGTGALLAAAAAAGAQQRTVYLADTFEGVVKAGAQDTRYQGGEHADTSLGLVEDLIRSMKLANVRTLKGIFPDDTAHEIDQPVALMHCDVDVYQSSKEVIEWVLPRLVPGAMIVFDDYGFSGCEGVTRYAHELRAQRRDFHFLHNLNGHAIFIRK